MQVTSFEPAYRPGVLALLDDVPFKPQIWQWQFEANPHAQEFSPIVVVENDEVIGFNGVMPVQVKYGDSIFEAIWSCDFYVDSRWRGQGVGKRIKQTLIQQSPLIMSLGVSPSASHVLSQMGWKRASDVYDYRCLRQARTNRDRLLKGLQFVNRARGLTGEGYGGDLAWLEVLPGEGEVDALWQRVVGQYRKICFRDHDYLHWKYAAHPLAHYDYLVVRTEEGALDALMVVRSSGEGVRLVDYLGPAGAYPLKRALARAVLHRFPHARRFNCTTSDAVLGRALCDCGFFRARTTPSFFVRSTVGDDSNCENGWFVMGGDSDGELLAAAADSYERNGAPDEAQHAIGLVVRRLRTKEFRELSDHWQELLEHSDADSLFLSWPWLYSWWETWSAWLGLELALYGAYSEDGTLVGLAPFYQYEFRSPAGFRIRRLQTLGNAWRIKGTVRTEYSGLILAQGYEQAAARALVNHLSRLDWQEMVVSDHSAAEKERLESVFHRSGQDMMPVLRMKDSGVRVAVSGHFEEWLASLGPNTRRKTYNRRRYLHQQGSLEYQKIPVSEAQSFLDRLNAFHCERWGKPCFDEEAVAFHRKLIERLAPDQVHLSALVFNGETVSVLYDICAGSVRYNLQSGFQEDFDAKVALGTLHFGYTIEESFAAPGVAYYDLLAGRGKNSFYKSQFRGEEVSFLTTQFVRHPLLRGIYRFQAWLPRRLRGALNRLVRL